MFTTYGKRLLLIGYCFMQPGHFAMVAVIQRWLPSTVTTIDRLHCMGFPLAMCKLLSVIRSRWYPSFICALEESVGARVTNPR